MNNSEFSLKNLKYAIILFIYMEHNGMAESLKNKKKYLLSHPTRP